MTDRYRTAVDLRRAIEDRLRQRATDTGTDVGRIRRSLVFERVLSRLAAAPGRWVLKGGAVLEFRMPERARVTKDLDLATRQPAAAEAIRDALIEATTVDADGDMFSFRVSRASSLAVDDAMRFSVEAWLAARLFETIRVDVVAREDELLATEAITLPGSLAFAGVPTREIEAVTPEQHFAEKLHAYTRTYDGRPNTRVKDLVDLVLLVDEGLVADERLLEVVAHVFAVRGTHAMPVVLPDPPPDWASRYEALAGRRAEYATNAANLDAAVRFVRDFWHRTLTSSR